MFVKAECKDETDEFFKMKELHTQKKKSWTVNDLEEKK